MGRIRIDDLTGEVLYRAQSTRPLALQSAAILDSTLATSLLHTPLYGDPKHPTTECLAAGTLVWTPEGTLPIEQIRAGDVVVTWQMGRFVENRVSLLDVHEGDFEVWEARVGEDIIIATPRHKFFGSSWVEMRSASTVLVTEPNLAAKSVRVRKVSRVGRVFNLRTLWGTYLIGKGGVLVSGGTMADLAPYAAAV